MCLQCFTCSGFYVPIPNIPFVDNATIYRNKNSHDKLNLDPILFSCSVTIKCDFSSIWYSSYGLLFTLILHAAQYVLIKSIDISGKLNCLKRISSEQQYIFFIPNEWGNGYTLLSCCILFLKPLDIATLHGLRAYCLLYFTLYI